MYKALQFTQNSNMRIAEPVGKMSRRQCQGVDAPCLIELDKAVVTYHQSLGQLFQQMPMFRSFTRPQARDLKSLAFRALARGGALAHKLLLDEYLLRPPFTMLRAVAAGH